MTTTTRATLTAAILTTATNALAATAGRVDTSGLYVWAFLGLCALIVTAQVVPAILMALGAARGVGEALAERKALKAGAR
ncbi:MAG: hypothetical protein ACYDA8_09980 [Deferrisomatales bacterium]